MSGQVALPDAQVAVSETSLPLAPVTQIPLIIGVTGHRDLVESDLPALRERIHGIFAEIRRDFQQTPLVVLSALAEGADRLVAEVALEARIPVVAPLPMRRDLYETDFAGPSNREFADWLDKSVRCWFELLLVEGYNETEITATGSARNKQYSLVGEYVARHSQVLIASTGFAMPCARGAAVGRSSCGSSNHTRRRGRSRRASN